MGRSNHTVMINREELEELERKAELLESLIMTREAMTQNDFINPGGYVLTEIITMDKEALRKIADMTIKPAIVNNPDLRHRNELFEPRVNHEIKVDVKVREKRNG